MLVPSLLRKGSDRREEPYGERGPRITGGGAPGWRLRPFGLVGAGSGDGVGRRGDGSARERNKRIKQGFLHPFPRILT